MQIIYSLVIRIYYFAITVSALLGNEKARFWLLGRKQWAKNLSKALSAYKGNERFWFHCASLGEFEQGRSLIERVRKEFPDSFILLTFFSPSGYEIRKNYSEVNHVSYLPLDTKKNAERFIKILQPSKTIFIKYEFWYNFIDQISKTGKPIYIASAIFRPQQIFFKWYGTFFRELLKKISFIFLQDNDSLNLLRETGITKCSVTGDTRFDRVSKVAIEAKAILKIEQFVKNKNVIVAGSTWPADEENLLKIFDSLNDTNLKLVIVPHEVSSRRINELKEKIIHQTKQKNITLYSDTDPDVNSSIMIVDTIGLLSSAYKYATLTWVGGGFNKGIHNILEPAAHGKPVLFGPAFEKFKEAHDLIANHGAFSVTDSEAGNQLIKKMLTDDNYLEVSGKAASEYVRKNTGATDKIFMHIFREPI